MSILIRGMEMPTSCRACMFSRTDIWGVEWCTRTEKDLPCDCPLVPIPPHGRLIDADALVKVLKDHADKMCGLYSLMIESCIERVKDAPTVIDAEVKA